MTVEQQIEELLAAIVPRVFPDVAPAKTSTPYATYQQVGGRSIAFLGTDLPSTKNGRFQVNVWGKRRDEVAALALRIENAFMASEVIQAEPLGEPVATYEEDTKLRGSRQDFSVWSDR